jgi:glycosyltransferase involved in cell wall biosynthesis
VIKRAAVNLPGVAADIVIAVSDFVAGRDKAVTLLAPEKIRRVWNGVDEVEPGSEDDRPDIRSLLGLSPDTAVIGCACRATRDKGVDVLFKAFDRVPSSPDKPAVLAYIGTGPKFNELAELRSGLACGARIYMVGYQPGAAALLRTASVCAVPSVWQDAFPLAVLEMMARGRAVVATRVGGVPEMIEDSVSGILVPPDDVGALAQALTRVLASPQQQNALGRAARQRASRLFSADRQISEMLGMFQDVFST